MDQLTVKWKKVKVAQSCPTLLYPTDYTIHGILQAEYWMGIFPTQGSNQVSHIAGGFFTDWDTREVQFIINFFY